MSEPEKKSKNQEDTLLALLKVLPFQDYCIIFLLLFLAVVYYIFLLIYKICHAIYNICKFCVKIVATMLYYLIREPLLFIRYPFTYLTSIVPHRASQIKEGLIVAAKVVYLLITTNKRFSFIRYLFTYEAIYPSKIHEGSIRTFREFLDEYKTYQMSLDAYKIKQMFLELPVREINQGSVKSSAIEKTAKNNTPIISVPNSKQSKQQPQQFNNENIP